MHDAAPSLVASWQNFYVIVGSSAAALTGLQFVVITLIADMRLENTVGGLGTFATPTIIHFGTALLLSGIVSAPWNGLAVPGALIACVGAAGLAYCVGVVRGAHTQTAYQLVLEDWIWHTILPFASHAALLLSGLAVVWHPTAALYTLAASSMLLMFIGIHNSWDTVTYLLIRRLNERREREEKQSPTP
jgi:hypothetical protein